jgi:Tol biopolymer transport system component
MPLLLSLCACGHADDRVVSSAEIVVMVDTDASPPGGNTPSDLFVMNLDGTAREQITHDDELEFLPHFSPDGTKLVYTKFLTGYYGSMGATTEIDVYDFTTQTETQLTSRRDAMQGIWSPDGSQIAFGSDSSIWVMDADGSNAQIIATSPHADLDGQWGDIAWSSDNWILFVVAQEQAGPCFKVRIDKMRPDGTERTKVSDGGASCTPTGMEQSGDADPGFSPDGQTIYTSRGLPHAPTGATPPTTERKLVSLSSDAWAPGKVETDLSLPSEPDCIEGVPKASPDGSQILVFRACFDKQVQGGVYATDAAGATRTFVTQGFGADWNPVAR